MEIAPTVSLRATRAAYGEHGDYPLCCSYRFANSRRSTFPINVLGKSSMKITKRGTRWEGRRRLAYSMIAFEVGGSLPAITKANGRPAIAVTATSLTCGI